MTIKIHNRKIGLGERPFIIAEMSANHGQSLEKAFAMLEGIASAGADAVKLQTLKPETITLDVSEGEFLIKDEKNLWNGQTLYELYEKAYLPWEWHKPIFERAKELGLIAFSTPFDLTAVDFLEELDVPCYKIGSCENRDIPLISRVAKTGKPLIISTGMATVGELDDAVRAARAAGCRDLVLLKCTCAYPADPKESHLRTIPHLRNLFDCEVGLSDHTQGLGVPVASIALGATVIEKHVKLIDESETLDSDFSMATDHLKDLVCESKNAWEALGTIQYGPTESEINSLAYRRSLYISSDVKEGDAFSAENIRSIRPGLGLAPKYYDILLGKKAKRDAKKGEPLSWDLIT